MDLPRFTSGAVGKLTFAHLNDAFETLDDLARDNGVGGSAAIRSRRVIAARIGASQGSDYAWNELERNGSSWTLKANGRSSALDQDLFAYPLVAFGGITPTTGSDLSIFPMHDATGRLIYVPLAGGGTSGPTGSPNFPAMIQGAQPIATGRWRYTIAEATVNTADGAWTAGASAGSAYNGCEAVQDLPNQLVGVGSGTGATASVSRNPIKIGTVVMISVDENDVRFFSVPNGYSYQCA
jgi:hypothetical protein